MAVEDVFHLGAGEQRVKRAPQVGIEDVDLGLLEIGETDFGFLDGELKLNKGSRNFLTGDSIAREDFLKQPVVDVVAAQDSTGFSNDSRLNRSGSGANSRWRGAGRVDQDSAALVDQGEANERNIKGSAAKIKNKNQLSRRVDIVTQRGGGAFIDNSNILDSAHASSQGIDEGVTKPLEILLEALNGDGEDKLFDRRSISGEDSIED